MKIGLAGLPMSGKTSIFNMATRAKAQTRDYSAQTDEINNGIIKVPDARIDHLVTIFKPKRPPTQPLNSLISQASATLKANLPVKPSPTSESAMPSCWLSDSCQRRNSYIHNRIDPPQISKNSALEFTFSDLEMVTNKIERLNKE